MQCSRYQKTQAPGHRGGASRAWKKPTRGRSEIFNMKCRHIVALLSAAAMSVALAGTASAQSTVKIGMILPLSGNAASAGTHGKAAIETAVEIINSGKGGLGNLPLTNNAGLKGLGGAKVEVIFAD